MQLIYLLEAVIVVCLLGIGVFWVMPAVLLIAFEWPNWQVTTVQVIYAFALGGIAWALFQKARGKS